MCISVHHAAIFPTLQGFMRFRRTIDLTYHDTSLLRYARCARLALKDLYAVKERGNVHYRACTANRQV